MRFSKIGCGTGKATEDLARRGLSVVALDPGPAMIAAARRRLAPMNNVRFVETTFEAWPAEAGPFQLVAAAQSWHWIASDIRFIKAFGVLAADGWLAVFGSAPGDVAAPLREVLLDVHSRHAPELAGPPPERAYLPSGPFAGEFDRSGLFGPVTHKSYAWRSTFSAPTYVAWLGTLSRYRLIDAARRERLFADLAEAIETHGGGFDLPFETHLYIARRGG
jgi:trans-aconitate methyltransferase